MAHCGRGRLKASPANQWHSDLGAPALSDTVNYLLEEQEEQEMGLFCFTWYKWALKLVPGFRLAGHI